MGQLLSGSLRQIMFSIGVASVLTASCFPVNATSWFDDLRKIKVLSSTRGEVEEVLDGATVTYSKTGKRTTEVSYEFSAGRLEISYSNGRCDAESVNGYDVVAGVVTDLYLKLEKPVKLSTLGIDLSGFDRSGIADMPDVFAYSNRQRGEYFVVLDGTGDNARKVSSLNFFPSDSLEHLSCGHQRK